MYALQPVGQWRSTLASLDLPRYEVSRKDDGGELVMEVVMIIPPGDILSDHHHSDHVASTNEHRGAVDQNFDQHLRDQQPRSVHPRYIFAKGND